MAAAEAGVKNIIILEARRVPGGNSVFPVGILATESRIQKRMGIDARTDEVFKMAMKYAQEREQFGKPIIKFQVNAFKLADMATEIEAARALLYRACWLKDTGKSFRKEAAMAKLYCSEMMGRVVNQAVQLFGGYGLMEEYGIARFYRDQKLLDIGEGTSEIQRLVISRLIGC